jgi:hypothetical protein
VIAIAVFAALALGFWIAWIRALPKELLLLIPLCRLRVATGLRRSGRTRRPQPPVRGDSSGPCDDIALLAPSAPQASLCSIAAGQLLDDSRFAVRRGRNRC